MSHGTGVPVSCLGDRELRGDKVITCNQGEEFKFQDKPKCNDIGMCNDLHRSVVPCYQLYIFDWEREIEVIGSGGKVTQLVLKRSISLSNSRIVVQKQT